MIEAEIKFLIEDQNYRQIAMKMSRQETDPVYVADELVPSIRLRVALQEKSRKSRCKTLVVDLPELGPLD